MKGFRILFSISCVLCLVNFCSSEALAGGPNIRVALGAGQGPVATLAMEDYLLGVLAAEVPDDWPEAAIAAQAVAARSYAYYRIAHPRHARFDVAAGVGDQAFIALPDYPAVYRRALRATRGQVLSWQGEIIPAFYHSCCGGKTERAAQVWAWAKAYPFYPAKADPYCAACPAHSWEQAVSKDELTIALLSQDLAGGEVDHIIPMSAEDGERIREVVVITDAETIVLPSNRFRQLVGYDRIRSTAFHIVNTEDQLLFLGAGHGHGVGLCQWGARGMAALGKSYRQILEFYYPEVEIQKR